MGILLKIIAFLLFLSALWITGSWLRQNYWPSVPKPIIEPSRTEATTTADYLPRGEDVEACELRKGNYSLSDFGPLCLIGARIYAIKAGELIEDETSVRCAKYAYTRIGSVPMKDFEACREYFN